jgi:hypothetical protein
MPSKHEALSSNSRIGEGGKERKGRETEEEVKEKT